MTFEAFKVNASFYLEPFREVPRTVRGEKSSEGARFWKYTNQYRVQHWAHRVSRFILSQQQLACAFPCPRSSLLAHQAIAFNLAPNLLVLAWLNPSVSSWNLDLSTCRSWVHFTQLWLTLTQAREFMHTSSPGNWRYTLSRTRNNP